MAFFVYILYSKKFDQYYVGQTNNMESRLQLHNSGFNKSTAPYVPWRLICKIEKEFRTEAMTLEKKLKNLNREKLQKFIAKYG